MWRFTRVRTRLWLGFAVLVTASAVIVAITIHKAVDLERSFQSILSTAFVNGAIVQEMRQSLQFSAIALRDVVVEQDFTLKRKVLNAVKEARKRYLKASERLTVEFKNTGGVDDHEVLRNISAADATAQEIFLKVIDLSLDEKHDEARRMILSHAGPAEETLYRALSKMEEYFEKASVRTTAKARAVYEQSLLTLVFIGGAFVLLGITLAYGITRSISIPLKDAVGLVNRVAKGDLRTVSVVKSSDEFGTLTMAMDQMQRSLVAILYDVQKATVQVSEQSGTVFDFADAVKRTAKDQAERLISIGNAVQEWSVTITQVHEGADGVLQASEDTRSLILETKRTFDQANQASSEIARTVSDSSKAMEDLAGAIKNVTAVTNVIRGIADQTNLLALNAAIEAARAGEQGRGFAIVADEVRILSHRTTSSTADIAKLVDEVMKKTKDVVAAMEHVARRVDVAGDVNRRAENNMDKIVVRSSSVSELAREITRVTGEQTKASEIIAGNVQVVSDEATDTRDRLETLEQSAHGLRLTAESLRQQVSQFNLAS